MGTTTMLLALTALAACGGRPGLEDDRPFLSSLPFATGYMYDDRIGELALAEVSRDKIILEFGGVLLNAETEPAGVVAPYMRMRVHPTAYVRSPLTGVVMSVERNDDSPENEDYEIRIRVRPTSRWEIVLDHIGPPMAVADLPIRGGFPVGKPVAGQDVEYYVVDLEDDSRRYCPNLFYGSVRNLLESEMTTLFGEWETYKQNPAIYDEDGMFAPGCAVEKL